MSNIGKTSIVKEGAKIGKNVVIGEFCIIDENVVIGDDCVIGNYVHIAGWTTLGRGNKVFNNAAVGVPPQDLKYAGEKRNSLLAMRILSVNLLRSIPARSADIAKQSSATRIFLWRMCILHTIVSWEMNAFWQIMLRSADTWSLETM